MLTIVDLLMWVSTWNMIPLGVCVIPIPLKDKLSKVIIKKISQVYTCHEKARENLAL